MIFVSIVMPAYNAAQYLSDAVKSVLTQTYPFWELIIVDDASVDETLDIAQNLQSQDSRIKVLSLQENKGIAEARNIALKNAIGKYIAFLDSDDLWLPEKLAKQIAHMEANQVLVCYSRYRRIDDNGNELNSVRPPRSLDYDTLLKSNFIGNLTGIYNAEVLGKQYFTDFKHEDYVAWLSLVKKAKRAESIDEELGLYRVYSGSNSANKLRTIMWQWRIYRISQSLSFVRCCWLMFNYAFYAIIKRK